MASVTGMTVAKLNAELDNMVTGVRLDGGFLIYERRDGSEVNAGALTDPDLAVDAAYPVNSIYTSTVPTNPGDAGMLGVGTWVRFGKGRVLVSQDDTVAEFATPSAEGGVKEVTLSSAQIPSHTHSINHTHASDGSHTHSFQTVGTEADVHDHIGGSGHGQAANATDSGTDVNVGSATLSAGAHTHGAFTGSSGSVGGGDAHTNLQPYIVVYIWKRTA